MKTIGWVLMIVLILENLEVAALLYIGMVIVLALSRIINNVIDKIELKKGFEL